MYALLTSIIHCYNVYVRILVVLFVYVKIVHLYRYVRYDFHFMASGNIIIQFYTTHLLGECGAEERSIILLSKTNFIVLNNMT